MVELCTGGVTGGAVISHDRRYRYSLTRSWPVDESTTVDPIRPVVWIMLNPSTADADTDDPTIRRVVGFTRRFGYRCAIVVNLYACRATDPRELTKVADPVGPLNDDMIFTLLGAAGLVVAAWGAHRMTSRAQAVRSIADDRGATLYCLGRTAGGYPRHPLYVRGDTRLELL